MLGHKSDSILSLPLLIAPAVLQLAPTPPAPAGEYAALLYGYYIFLLLIIALLGLIALLLRGNWNQSARHTQITEQFNETADSFKDTMRSVSETTNRRLAVVEDRQAQAILGQASIAKIVTTTQNDLDEHDNRAIEFIKNSNQREQETLDIVRELPAKIETVTSAVDALRKDALQQLEEMQTHLDLQFDAARMSINTSFSNMTAALVANPVTPDGAQSQSEVVELTPAAVSSQADQEKVT